MKKIITLLLSLTIGFVANAQRSFSGKMETMKGHEVVCPANHLDANTYVPLNEKVVQALEAKKARGIVATQNSTILVEYSEGFPESAKRSFQRAVDTWAVLLSSEVPIRIGAFWRELAPGVLGSASASDFNRNFPGAGKVNVWYPIALAEKMAGRELNSINDYDVVCSFSSEIDWYFGTINPARGQYDFESVVLHELGHGLGFIGSMDVDEEAAIGSWGYGTTAPFIFDTYSQNGAGKALTDTLNYKNETRALRNELISDDIFFNSPLAIKANGGLKPKLYTPNQWNSGSSFSHLDDATFPSGNKNSLMTSSASQRERVLDPGAITLNMFADMGWKSTSVVHDRLKDFTSKDDVLVKARIRSDTGIVAGTPKLIYSFDQNFGDSTVIEMKQVGKTDEYQATIKTNGESKLVLYYISVLDKEGKTAVSPPAPSQKVQQYIWVFETGIADKNGPVIDYDAPTIIGATNEFPLLVNVEDDFEGQLDTVYVEYALNGAKQAPFGLKKYNFSTDNKELSQGSNDESAYLLEGAFGTIKVGDRITYQITAIDAAGNKTTIPTTFAGTNETDPATPTTYEMTATSLTETVATYKNTFDASTTDFALIGFEVGKTSDFNNGILYTQGGYSNGKGLVDPVTGRTYLSFDNNAIAMLRSPIQLSGTKANATISFDEVVLVEPGEEGSVYGDEDFWDYVIVEVASLNDGVWRPLIDGYDSRANATWLNTFNSGLSTGDRPVSNAEAKKAMMKNRVINIYDASSAGLEADEEFIVRFRLYADQFVRGWGWAIDNLYIQQEAPKPLANEPISIQELVASPNPTADNIQFKITLDKPQTLNFEIFKVTGGKVFSEKIESKSTEFDYQLSTTNFASGTYVLKLSTNEGAKTKRFVVQH